MIKIKGLKSVEFECVLVVSIMIILLFSLFLFQHYYDIVKMILVSLTNTLVYAVTRYFDARGKNRAEKYYREKDKNNDAEQ